MEEHTLEHHGIYGQKWGIRRFQNPDGSLTPAGQKRYGVGIGNSRSSKETNRTEISQNFNFNTNPLRNLIYGKREIDKIGHMIYDTLANAAEGRSVDINTGMNFVGQLGSIPINAVANTSATYNMGTIKDASTQKQENTEKTTKVDASMKSINKDFDELFKDYDSKPRSERARYKAISEIAALTPNKKPINAWDMATKIFRGVYDEGGDSDINEFSLYVNENNKVDKAQKLNEKYKQVSSVLGTNDWKDDYNFALYDRGGIEQATYKFTDSDKRAVKRAESMIKNLKDNKDGSWWYLTEVVEDLNLGDKDTEKLTKSDWDKINARLRSLAVTQGGFSPRAD